MSLLDAHVALAVKLWRKRLHERGVVEPDGLDEYERHFIQLAARGQNRTDQDTQWLDDLLAAYGDRMFYSRAEVAAKSGKSLKTIGRLIAARELYESVLGIPGSELDRLANPKETPCGITK